MVLANSITWLSHPIISTLSTSLVSYRRKMVKQTKIISKQLKHRNLKEAHRVMTLMSQKLWVSSILSCTFSKFNTINGTYKVIFIIILILITTHLETTRAQWMITQTLHLMARVPVAHHLTPLMILMGNILDLLAITWDSSPLIFKATYALRPQMLYKQ